ncbi:hypothetical protein EJ06DRAFT_524710 [Trichodelitschia bisporula]|uniref:Zn(2)-C6 fungal-type domain-containing protein n=1 Tax=Trichodelitschia bisporula TaxID=703511 RepID=A0A6G1HKL7_9PEZI|nr:hypothetical protein EJ06DRAFT_524710 [Trichodelitschia bisporula]
MPGRNGKRKATDDMPDRKGKRKATDDGQQVARRKAPRVRDLPQSNIICFRANPNAPGPSRAPLSVERKQQVKEVRDLGACMRCAWLRKPCSGGDPCIPCLELAALKNNATCLSWMPCYRLNLTEHFEHFLLRWSMHVSELNISVDASMLIPFFKLEEFSSINLNDLLSTFWGLCSSSGYSREAYWISEIPWDEIPDDAAELISRPGLESCGSKPVYSTYFNVITPVGSCMHLLRRLEKMLMPRQLAKLSHTQLQDVFHLLVYSATAYAMNMRQSQVPATC